MAQHRGGVPCGNLEHLELEGRVAEAVPKGIVHVCPIDAAVAAAHALGVRAGVVLAGLYRRRLGPRDRHGQPSA